MRAINPGRIRILKEGIRKPGPIAYWMSRDQRVSDNWALIFTRELAIKYKQPPVVVFCLVNDFLEATEKHYNFMLRGLNEVGNRLKEKNISFFILKGLPEKEIPEFIARYNIGTLVSDFDPLKIKRKWKKNLAKKINIPFYEVDAHNIVPCRVASGKQEYGAYTIRPKISRLLPEYLDRFSSIEVNKIKWKGPEPVVNWSKITGDSRYVNKNFKSNKIIPGENEAKKVLKRFMDNKINTYNNYRNDPTKDNISCLSPYIHFGHISAQRVALEVLDSNIAEENKNSFLDELIIRRELSDNYCFYNSNYDSFSGFPGWAQETLNNHRLDRREYIYSPEEFEEARTHDKLWNAAQLETIIKGKMHSYMRMYWAKKILEWSESPEEAQDIAIYLNNKYELDGRDPNGYTGIAWSMGGVHDRAWKERPVFGKIRYMSYGGSKSKFDVNLYIKSIYDML
jgi:deoxyribodipyrimidine photo-lyase